MLAYSIIIHGVHASRPANALTFSRVHAYIFKNLVQIAFTFLSSICVAYGMTFDFQFSQGWYVLFSAFLLAWLMMAIMRRKHLGKKEVKEQFMLGLIGSCALLSMEIFAASVNLWNYVPRNWPVILWPTYFVAILFGYQLLRLIEKAFS